MSVSLLRAQAPIVHTAIITLFPSRVVSEVGWMMKGREETLGEGTAFVMKDRRKELATCPGIPENTKELGEGERETSNHRNKENTRKWGGGVPRCMP